MFLASSLALVFLVSLWILAPLLRDELHSSVAQGDDTDLTARYTQALIDLESDLHGGRISTDEYNERYNTLTEYAKKRGIQSDEVDWTRK